jgi:four helix bundle protein
MSKVRFEFETLTVYQKAIDLVEIAYKASAHMPVQEMYGLRSQLQRAATGIALNIAEGTGGTKTEFRHYLQMAVRSVRECVAITEVATRVGYFKDRQKEFLRERLAELARMLTGLRKSVKKDKP